MRDFISISRQENAKQFNTEENETELKTSELQHQRFDGL